MKQLTRLPLILVAWVALAACQTTSLPDASKASAPLEYLPALKGDYFKYASGAVGRPFHVYVAFPESYAKDAGARYPVVYLLDGDSSFPIHATYHWFLNSDLLT